MTTKVNCNRNSKSKVNRDLFKAVDCGDIDMLRIRFLNVLKTEKDAENCNALHRAARYGQTELIKWLVTELNFDVNDISKDKTPLFEASCQGHLSAVQALLAAGAQIERSKFNEWNPLHSACSKGFTEVVNELLSAATEHDKSTIVIESKNKEGSTPLSLACRGGHWETVKVLLQFGADVNTKNQNNRVPLLSACAAGSLKTVQVLVNEGHCDTSIDVVVDSAGSTPLHEAATCENGDELIEWFRNESSCKEKAQLWITHRDGAERLPIHIAVIDGHNKPFRCLLNAQPENRNIQDYSGATPLFLGSIHGHVEVVAIALSFGCNEHIKDNSGRTPLEIARAWKKDRIIHVLERRVMVLQDGSFIPSVGLGTYRLVENTRTAVEYALKSGNYRCIDTAEFYGNELQVGEGIIDSKIDRKDVFVITKVWNNHTSSGQARQALLASLERMKLKYLDLILIHWPCPGYESAFGDLLKARNDGLVRHVGVSNFLPEHVEALWKRFHEYPAVNQIELSVFYNRSAQIEYFQKRGIVVQAYRSLGNEGFVHKSGGNMNNDVVAQIAEHKHKTTSQVLLRWSLQKGVCIIPKSKHFERIDENGNLFDFILSNEDMTALDKLSLQGIEERWMATVFAQSIQKDIVE